MKLLILFVVLTGLISTSFGVDELNETLVVLGASERHEKESSTLKYSVHYLCSSDLERFETIFEKAKCEFTEKLETLVAEKFGHFVCLHDDLMKGLRDGLKKNVLSTLVASKYLLDCFSSSPDDLISSVEEIIDSAYDCDLLNNFDSFCQIQSDIENLIDASSLTLFKSLLNSNSKNPNKIVKEFAESLDKRVEALLIASYQTFKIVINLIVQTFVRALDNSQSSIERVITATGEQENAHKLLDLIREAIQSQRDQVVQSNDEFKEFAKKTLQEAQEYFESYIKNRILFEVNDLIKVACDDSYAMLAKSSKKKNGRKQPSAELVKARASFNAKKEQAKQTKKTAKKSSANKSVRKTLPIIGYQAKLVSPKSSTSTTTSTTSATKETKQTVKFSSSSFTLLNALGEFSPPCLQQLSDAARLRSRSRTIKVSNPRVLVFKRDAEDPDTCTVPIIRDKFAATGQCFIAYSAAIYPFLLSFLTTNIDEALTYQMCRFDFEPLTLVQRYNRDKCDDNQLDADFITEVVDAELFLNLKTDLLLALSNIAAEFVEALDFFVGIITLYDSYASEIADSGPDTNDLIHDLVFEIESKFRQLVETSLSYFNQALESSLKDIENYIGLIKYYVLNLLQGSSMCSDELHVYTERFEHFFDYSKKWLHTIGALVLDEVHGVAEIYIGFIKSVFSYLKNCLKEKCAPVDQT